MGRIRISTLAMLALAAACGGDDTAAREPADRAVAEGPIGEDPGLPTDTSQFAPRGDAGPDLEGTLWVSRSRPTHEHGISLIAELRGVPPRAYGWAVHRGGCDAPENLALALGWGTEAAIGRSVKGGPLGEMKPAFEPSPDGEVAETVWVPFQDGLDRARLEAEPHSLRIHPEPGDDRVHPSVACAPLPELPERTG